MNVSDLITQFRLEVSDVAQPYLWSDDEVTSYLSEAEEEACIRARLIRDNTTQSIVQISILPNVTQYAFDPSIIEIVYASMVYAGSPSMFPYVLGIISAAQLDMIRPAWRQLPYRPTSIIHYDTYIETDCIPDTAYTLNLEVYRTPITTISAGAYAPEIGVLHHRHLVKWAKYRAYGKQDADAQDLLKSEKALAEFEDKFGKPVDAAYRKGSNGNRPHRNVCW